MACLQRRVFAEQKAPARRPGLSTLTALNQNADPPPPPNPPPEKPPPLNPPPLLNPEPLELARGAAVNASYVELVMLCIEFVKKIGLKYPGWVPAYQVGGFWMMPWKA